MKRYLLPLALLAYAFTLAAQTGIWQWSIPVRNFSKSPKHKECKAYLWIPDTCRQVKAIVVAQHNMEEISILEDKGFRTRMAELGVAEVWVCPAFNLTFDFSDGAGETLEGILRDLAYVSGYDELVTVPLIGMGHSAAASAPYYMAAYMPERTLACLSVSGQWPYFRNPAFAKDIWGDRNINNIPCLETMGEYEAADTWSREGLKERQQYPQLALGMLACPGEGHFAYTPEKAEFIALFIKKALQYGHTDPRREGWLAEKWRKDAEATCPPAPVDRYEGDKAEAFWFFDKEMAEAAVEYGNLYRGLRPQLVSVKQNGKIVKQRNTHLQLHPEFLPEEDGVSFELEPVFLDTVPGESPRLSAWTGLPVGSSIGHADEKIPIYMEMICGPAIISGDRFRIAWNRGTGWEDEKADITFAVKHPGDKRYKPAVQQGQISIPVRNDEGEEQTIDFIQPADVEEGTSVVMLNATSTSGLPVSFYVESGPAYVDGNKLHLTAVPPHSKFPVKISVTAWQYGIKGKVRTAEPVTRSFYLDKAKH